MSEPKDDFPRPGGTRPVEAFCFNLDAEDELANPQHLSPRTVRRLITRRVPGLQQRLCPGDVAVVDGTEKGAHGLPARAWCPTPTALTRLRQAGAVPRPAPGLAVLQTVNHRAFGLALEQSLDPAAAGVLVHDVGALTEAVAEGSRLGFVVKPAFGFAGRGQCRLSARPTPREIEASAEALSQSAVVEPLLEREEDFSLHGYITREGAVRLGRPVQQVCSPLGVWQASRLATRGSLTAAELGALGRAAEAVAGALCAAGYFGPFGIDAFRYRDQVGRRRFRALVEVNARYTMAWPTGFF